MSHGWTDNHNIDRECQSDDLNEFVDLVVSRHPGWMGNYFEKWLGQDYDGLAYVGRFESLLDDLCKALKLFGQPFDEGRLRRTEPHNVGNKKLFPGELSEDLKLQVVKSEHRLISTFYEKERKDG